MSERVLSTPDFCMLGFYLCPWRLLGIVEIRCGRCGIIYVTSYTQKILPSSYAHYDLELEGAIQIESKLLPDLSYPHLSPETGEPTFLLNTFGEWTFSLCHSPSHCWSILTIRKFLSLLSWNLPSWDLYPLNLVLFSGWCYSTPKLEPHDLSHSTLNKFEFVNVLLEGKRTTPGPAWQSEAEGTQPPQCWIFCSASLRWNDACW